MHARELARNSLDPLLSYKLLVLFMFVCSGLSAVVSVFRCLISTLQRANTNRQDMADMLTRCNLLLDIIFQHGVLLWNVPGHESVTKLVEFFCDLLVVSGILVHIHMICGGGELILMWTPG